MVYMPLPSREMFNSDEEYQAALKSYRSTNHYFAAVVLVLYFVALFAFVSGMTIAIFNKFGIQGVGIAFLITGVFAIAVEETKRALDRWDA